MDDRIRKLERDGDAARALQVRLRAGELQEETLRLAARCGFAPAAEALGVALVQPPEVSEVRHYVDVDRVADWATDLFEEQPPALWLRAILGTVALRSLPPRASDARARDALEVAQAWLECPCEEHAEAAREASFTRSFGHCDDAKIVLEGAALIALEVAAGEASASRAATAIRALTHPLGGDSPAHVRDALLETLRAEWAPLL